MDRLDPKSIEVFQTVIETSSATLAAERLGMTQPGVTKAIATLEARTGLTLFARGRFGMRPTAEGRLLAEAVRRSFAGLDRIAAAAAAIRQGLTGSVVIATVPLYAEGLVAQAIGGLVAESPDLAVEVTACPQDETFRRVLAETTDLGVVMGPFSQNAQLVVHTLGRRRLMVVMGVGHPLANRSELDVPDLADIDIVMLSSLSPYRESLLQVFASHAVPIRSRVQVVTQRGAVTMALAAGLAAIVDEEVAREAAHRDPMVHVAAFTAIAPWDLAVVHHREHPLSRVAEAALRRLKLAAGVVEAEG
jgi:DNA-binding transcriptional LysR family regulator